MYMETTFWHNLKTPALVLAPMVGISDSAFRQICKEWGADVLYSEMISADALTRKASKAHAMLQHAAPEYPFVVQIMGKNPTVLADAARIAEKAGANGIDINFGCPAHKIARNECGVMLMRQPDLCRTLIAAVINAVSIPLSIKVRVSIRNQSKHGVSHGATAITILDMLEKVHDLPIAAIMVHGRSFEDPFEGGIRADMIRAVKERFVSGPVYANGGITSVESSREVLAITGADGLGLARSAIGKPWIFKQIRDYLSSGTYEAISWDTVKETLIHHVELFDATRGATPFRDIRRHLTHYIKGHAKASEIRQKLVASESVADVKNILKEY